MTSEPNRLCSPSHRQDRRGRVQLQMRALPGLDRRRARRDPRPGQGPARPPQDPLHHPDDPLRGGEREHQDDRREQQPPVLGERGEPVFQDHEGDGAPERAEELVHAPQHHHQQRVTRMLPAQVVGIGAAQQQGEQRAGIADHAAHHHEGDQFHQEGVVAQAAHPLLVVAQRLQGAAERGVRDPPQQPHAQGDGDQGEGVEHARVREQRAGHVLQPVLAAGERGPFERDLERGLRERQGEQGEIQPAPAQDDDADQQRQQQAEADREDQRHRLVGQAAQQGDRGGVAGAAEEHRRAERHQPGVADQQVHRRAIQGVDGDLGDQALGRVDGVPQRGEREQHHAHPQDRVAQHGGQGGAARVRTSVLIRTAPTARPEGRADAAAAPPP